MNLSVRVREEGGNEITILPLSTQYTLTDVEYLISQALDFGHPVRFTLRSGSVYELDLSKITPPYDFISVADDSIAPESHLE